MCVGLAVAALPVYYQFNVLHFVTFIRIKGCSKTVSADHLNAVPVAKYLGE